MALMVAVGSQVGVETGRAGSMDFFGISLLIRVVQSWDGVVCGYSVWLLTRAGR